MADPIRIISIKYREEIRRHGKKGKRRVGKKTGIKERGKREYMIQYQMGATKREGGNKREEM